jgi:hypothetical protein
MNQIDFLCLAMLDRLNLSCHSLEILFEDLKHNTKSEYSCGIIARSVLLDTMISLNAMIKLLDEDEKRNENLNDYCSIWLADSLKHSIDNVSKLYEHKSKEERENLIQSFINYNPDFFEEETISSDKPMLKGKFKKPHKPEQLYNNIKNSDLRMFASVYEGYLFYSKYDHFGQLFYEISRKDIKMRIDFLNRAIGVFPHHFYYLLVILRYFNLENKTLNTSIEKAQKFINIVNEAK